MTITDHGRPVAKLSRIEAQSVEMSAPAATDVARPSIAPLPADFPKRRLPTADGRRAIADDRKDRF